MLALRDRLRSQHCAVYLQTVGGDVPMTREAAAVRSPHSSWPRLTLDLLTPLALYAAAVTWLTWPLALFLSTRLPGTPTAYDALFTAWVLSWETHALATDPSRLLDTNIYYPTKRTLFYGPTVPGLLPYFAPPFVLSGNPTLALNLTTLASVTLTAWTLHVVIWRWTRSHLAGVIAACAWLTNRWVLWTAALVPQWAVVQYLPLIVALTASPAPSFRHAALTLPFILLQCLSEPMYVAPAVGAVLGLIALRRAVQPVTRAAGLRLLGALTLAGIPLLPIYAGYLDVVRRNPDLEAQTPWLIDPKQWIAMTPWPWQGGPAALSSAAVAVGALGAGLYLRRTLVSGTDNRLREAWQHATLWMVIGFVLALPCVFLTPLTRIVRVPVRFGVIAGIALCLLAGLGFSECVRWFAGRRLARPLRAAATGFAVALMYWGYLTGRDPLRSQAEPIVAYPTFEAPAADSTPLRIAGSVRGPLLELPVDVDGQMRAAVAMYRSISGWQPLLNGYSSYFPADFPARMALAGRLPDAEALVRLWRETGVTAVLVHLDTRRLSPQQRAFVELARRGGGSGLQLMAHDDKMLVFYVTIVNGSVPGPDGAP